MREESLVQSKETLGTNGFGETIGNAAVKIAVLVVHTGHDGV